MRQENSSSSMLGEVSEFGLGYSDPYYPIDPMFVDPMMSDPFFNNVLSYEDRYLQSKAIFDAVAEKHTILRVMVAVNAPTLKDHYYNEYENLKTLEQLILPIEKIRFEGMYNYLREIVPGRKFSIGEIISLIRKLILREDIKFPEIELSTRMIKFLKEIGVNPSEQEKYVRESKVNLQKTRFNLIADQLRAKQEITLAEKMTYTSDRDMLVANAQAKLAEIEKLLLSNQQAISKVEEQLKVFQNMVLTDEELLNFILVNEDDKALRMRIEEVKNLEAVALKMVTAFQAEIKPILDERSIYVNKMSPLLTERTRLRNLVATNPSYEPEYQSILNQIGILSGILNEIENRLNAIYAKQTELKKSNPELFPTANTQVTLKNELNGLLEKYIKTKPDALMRISQAAMKNRASYTDSVMEQMLLDQQNLVGQKQEVFAVYLKAKADSELKYYTDQIKISQDGYNKVIKDLQDRELKLSSLQDNITANIDALGGTIGWFANKSNLGESEMEKPYFMNVALTAIRDGGKKEFNGKMYGIFEYSVFSAQMLMFGSSHIEYFWKGAPGESITMASNTLNLMSQLKFETDDFNYGEGKRLRDMIEKIREHIVRLHEAYKITLEKINSKEYVTQAMSEFRQLPENLEYTQAQELMKKQIRDINAIVQYKYEQLENLMEEIEESSLRENGIDFPDIRSMDFNSKYLLWLGVDDYLETNKDRVKEVRNILSEILNRYQKGEHQESDTDHMALCRQILLNVQMAQLVVRKFDRDNNFRLTVLKTREHDIINQTI